jgi:dTDP-4-dehydrorhamnose 3,5-epimerase
VKFRESVLPGVYYVEPEPRRESAAGQSRLFCARSFSERGLDARVGQSTIVKTQKRGTIRGMHLLRGDARLVRCINGRIFHVVIDLREDSQAYAKWEGVVLREEDDRSIYVPPGVAHGFQSLTNDVVLLVQHAGQHAENGMCGVRYDDPRFSISWPVPDATLSPRDLSFAPFEPGQVVPLLDIPTSFAPPSRRSFTPRTYPGAEPQ